MQNRWIAWISLAACASVGCAGRARSADVSRDVAAEAIVPTTDAGPTVELVLQARTGAQGGNESIVTLGDSAGWSRIEPSEHELDFLRPPATSDRATAYTRSPRIPDGMALVVEAIDVYATAGGDSNGPGRVDVRIGPGSLLRLEDDGRPVMQWFAGRTVVRSGREGDIAARLANSSAVDVRVHGRFAPLESLFGVFEEPFVPAVARAAVARAASAPPGTHGIGLEQPRAWLQLRSGAGGGNPNRIDLAGRKSMYVDRYATEPLSFATSPTMSERAVAYVEGGLIPRGKLFVVTSIDYAGSAEGDSNGHGELIVSVKGTTIVSVRDQPDPVRGTWSGRIEIGPGEESTVFAEIANSSTADVRLRGELVDAPKALGRP